MSYLNLRQIVGLIGMAMPFLVVTGRLALEGPGTLSSISSYYYSVMGGVFTGSLWAIGVFLLTYQGYDKRDDTAGNIAALFAVGTALLPTTPDVNITSLNHTIGTVHLILAGGLFITLSYFALVLFRKTDPSRPPSRMKLVRNRIYTICGSTMLISIALMFLVTFFPNPDVMRFHPILLLESLAIITFGISWFVKGEAIFKDEVQWE